MRYHLKPSTDDVRGARGGIVLLVAIVAVMWVVEAVNSIDHNALDNAGGIYPRNFDHLWAIFTSPFLHQNFSPHLLDNTIPLLFMGVIIALRGARRLAAVTLVVIIVGGLGTWIASPSGSSTIGASGIVFGYATYLFARGLFNRSLLEIGVGLIVGVLWGGVLVYSVIPHAGVSWQGHVAGAVGGVVAAWIFAKPRSRGSASGAGSGGAGRSSASASSSRDTSRFGGRDLHDALDRALS